jgi:hypothetical protein
MCWSDRGHTHEDLDSLFALVAMYLIKNKFDSADELVHVLNSWIRSLPVGTHAKEGSLAAKLDEVSDWPPGFPYVEFFLRNSTPPPPCLTSCHASGRKMYVIWVGGAGSQIPANRGEWLFVFLGCGEGKSGSKV